MEVWGDLGLGWVVMCFGGAVLPPDNTYGCVVLDLICDF